MEEFVKFVKSLGELPVVKPLVALLRSRKFLVAVFTVVLTQLEGQYPELAKYHAEFVALGLAVIGGIALEDYAAKKASAPSAPAKQPGEVG
jgi:hypothetical protein